MSLNSRKGSNKYSITRSIRCSASDTLNLIKQRGISGPGRQKAAEVRKGSRKGTRIGQFGSHLTSETGSQVYSDGTADRGVTFLCSVHALWHALPENGGR